MMRASIVQAGFLCLTVLVGNAAADLVSNGSFESGAGGFSSDYLYSSDLTASGTVVVGVDPCDHHPQAVSYGDHTSGRGRMLIANGSPDGSAAVWEQTVSIVPNTEYAFYYWLSAWSPATTLPAQIRCLFDGVRTGPAGFAPPEAGEWSPVLFRWKSGAASKVAIRLVDRTGAIQNNDFALDDIGMIATGGDCVLLTASTLGGSVDSPGEGAFLYPPGETVALEAKCDPGYEFAGWSGQISDPGVRVWVDMNADCVATAAFRELDYPVTIRAAGALPNEFSACDPGGDRLSVLRGAMESWTPNGLILGERKGLCGATYRFPIFRPAGGISGLSRIVVNVYGTTISAGSTVWIADAGPHRPIVGNVHASFGPGRIAEILDDSEDLVYWLPVRINAAVGNWDLAAVYVSYECPGIPETLLRRFHDHFSVCHALERYASDQSVRDLYALRSGEEPVWEAVMQAWALAENLPAADGVSVDGDLRGWMDRWRAPLDSSDPAALVACDSQQIVSCLDRAVSSGRSHVHAYAAALGDGILSPEEASQLNLGLDQWRADLSALQAAMQSVFESLCDVAGPYDGSRRTAAETMILAMSPWLSGTRQESGGWTLASPSYLERVLRLLEEFQTQ